MKTTSIVLCLSTLLVAAATASAGDNEKPQKAKPAPEKNKPAVTHAEKPVELTGSYIKRAVRQNGRITDGPFEVVVIDRAMIERSGAQDLRQLLVQQRVGR